MDITPQNIVNYLLAPAGAIPSDQPGIYLLTQNEHGLVEKLFTGTELADQSRVSSDVRKNTPALYLLSGEKRYVFSVDAKDNLRCYNFDVEEEAWEELGLRGDPNQPIVVHPSTKLSGGIIHGRQVVFFEGLDGQFHLIEMSSDGENRYLPPIPVQSLQARPHSVVVSDDGFVHLLYIHQDHHVHHLTKDVNADEFVDKPIAGSRFEDDHVINFVAIPDKDMNFDMFTLTSAGKLILIDKEGTRTVLGNVSNDLFVAASSEECVIETMALIGKGIRAASGMISARGK